MHTPFCFIDIALSAYLSVCMPISLPYRPSSVLR